MRNGIHRANRRIRLVFGFVISFVAHLSWGRCKTDDASVGAGDCSCDPDCDIWCSPGHCGPERCWDVDVCCDEGSGLSTMCSTIRLLLEGCGPRRSWPDRLVGNRGWPRPWPRSACCKHHISQMITLATKRTLNKCKPLYRYPDVLTIVDVFIYLSVWMLHYDMSNYCRWAILVDLHVFC